MPRALPAAAMSSNAAAETSESFASDPSYRVEPSPPAELTFLRLGPDGDGLRSGGADQQIAKGPGPARQPGPPPSGGSVKPALSPEGALASQRAPGSGS